MECVYQRRRLNDRRPQQVTPDPEKRRSVVDEPEILGVVGVKDSEEPDAALLVRAIISSYLASSSRSTLRTSVLSVTSTGSNPDQSPSIIRSALRDASMTSAVRRHSPLVCWTRRKAAACSARVGGLLDSNIERMFVL